MSDDDKEPNIGGVFVGLATAGAALRLATMGGLGLLGGGLVGALIAGGFVLTPVLIGAVAGGIGMAAIGGMIGPYQESITCGSCEKTMAPKAGPSLDGVAADIATSRHRERVTSEQASPASQSR